MKQWWRRHNSDVAITFITVLSVVIFVFAVVGAGAVSRYGWDLVPDEPANYTCELVRSEVL
jgi:hypothetical protein